ncbi:unnamed protein product [Fusarium venenatum]|uniref:Uncharacterized protein n=1 Tax=Fusarium venenatum TaxID=56646 RepID=A0A2L2T4Q8_9HYPO|nr:uncharacterized protein FVRRES_07109 [Fusarium venenatum]CEI62673.1 unnamed protein product [Fusarium venenatum]
MALVLLSSSLVYVVAIKIPTEVAIGFKPMQELWRRQVLLEMLQCSVHSFLNQIGLAQHEATASELQRAFYLLRCLVTLLSESSYFTRISKSRCHVFKGSFLICVFLLSGVTAVLDSMLCPGLVSIGFSGQEQSTLAGCL